MLFSQIIPPSPSPTESKSLFCASVSFFCLAYREKTKNMYFQNSNIFLISSEEKLSSYGKNRVKRNQNDYQIILYNLLNILPRLVITFLPKSKRHLIPWLQSPSAVILEPPKNKVCNCLHCFSIYLP